MYDKNILVFLEMRVEQPLSLNARGQNYSGST